MGQVYFVIDILVGFSGHPGKPTFSFSGGVDLYVIKTLYVIVDLESGCVRTLSDNGLEKNLNRSQALELGTAIWKHLAALHKRKRQLSKRLDKRSETEELLLAEITRSIVELETLLRNELPEPVWLMCYDRYVPANPRNKVRMEEKYAYEPSTIRKRILEARVMTGHIFATEYQLFFSSAPKQISTFLAQIED